MFVATRTDGRTAKERAMTSDLSKDEPRDHAPDEAHDPLSAGPHGPCADGAGQAAATRAEVRNRVPDQEEIPAQHNPNALAKALLRQSQTH
jgi:hypothetical protein